jgi:hypothetical protein
MGPDSMIQVRNLARQYRLRDGAIHSDTSKKAA